MTNTCPTPEVQDLQDLVKQIVELREQMKQVEADKQRAQEQLNTCSTQMLGLKQQMREARKLLDHCLDTGEDVTAVKLTKTISELSPRKHMLTENELHLMDKYQSLYLQAITKTSKHHT